MIAVVSPAHCSPTPLAGFPPAPGPVAEVVPYGDPRWKQVGIEASTCHGARPVCLHCRVELVDAYGSLVCPTCKRVGASVHPCPHPIATRRMQGGRWVPVCAAHEVPSTALVARIGGW
jgi:hypothetical protein